MGAACNSFCSNQDSVTHIQPDTESMKSRSNNSHLSSSTSHTTARESICDDIVKEFYQSIEQGNDNMVMYYISEYPEMDLQNIRFKNNDLAIHVATKNKQYTIIEYLLEQEASINAQNTATGDTALHLASRMGDVNCVNILIKNRSDINITNNDHEKALDIANECDHTDIIYLLSTSKSFIKVNGGSTPVTTKMKSFANCLFDISNFDENGEQLDKII